nr:hypothetical protein [Anaerolineae bacterium]
MSENDDPLVMLAETENFAVFTGKDADGELVYNIELGSMTVHMFQEEWDEFVLLIKDAAQAAEM